MTVSGWDQRALAQDAAVAQTGARHEDRPIADLAQVTDGGANDRGAVTEDGALTYSDRPLECADHHAVLQDGRMVADPYRCAVRPHDQALREYRASTHLYLTHNHGGAGDHGLGLVNEKLVEAHRGLTSSWPVGHPAIFCANTTHASVCQPDRAAVAKARHR